MKMFANNKKEEKKQIGGESKEDFKTASNELMSVPLPAVAASVKVGSDSTAYHPPPLFAGLSLKTPVLPKPETAQTHEVPNLPDTNADLTKMEQTQASPETSAKNVIYIL